MNTEAPRAVPIGRKALAIPLSAILIAGLIMVVQVIAGTEFGPPAVQQEESIPVTGVPVSAGGTPTAAGDVWDGPRRIEWPSPARGVVDVGASHPDLPVSITATGDGPSRVEVEVKDRDGAENLGLTGPLFTASGVDGDGEVELTFRYAEFVDLYGGDWGARLRLVELPGCAATTPWRSECQGGQWLSTDNTDGTVSAMVTLSSSDSVFGLAAEEESESGDYKATDLEPAGEWTAGGNSGGFSYKYPLGGPPTEGPQPSIDLTYSSQSIDGRTSGANNQARWAGDGWSISTDYIERSYMSCTDDREVRDGKTPNNANTKTQDQCWFTDNATVSLNGINASLVKNSETGRWHTDNNWRIEQLSDSALNGYDDNGEYWQITTEDGTRYLFGREPASSKSTWTTPVYGNHPGEPCHKTAFKDSSCKQAWRWMLDTVIDPVGNMARYHYQTETGHYGAGGDANNRVSYIRNGWLERIDYGLHTDHPDVAATARISFTAEDRCFKDPCWKDDAKTKPEPKNWPDVPWDAVCEKAPCTYTKTPSFFTQKRLAEVSTSVRIGEDFVKVNTWKLEHESRKPGDNTTPILWLKSITRVGHHNGEESMPTIEFTPVGMDNRVDTLDGIDPLHRFRIGNIRTESGSDIHITYSVPECDRDGTMPAKPEDNAMRCHPVYWTPDNHEKEILDWFHKYVVTEISEIDNTGGSVPVTTRYEYHLDGGGTEQLWAYDTNVFTKKKHRTYGEWRGYPRVTVRVGDPANGAPLTTEERYYRGMNGEKLPEGTRSVELTDSRGDTVVDHEALAGNLFESITYDGDDIFSTDVNRYWIKKIAEHTVDGVTAKAHLSGVSESISRSLLAADSWRTTKTVTEYNDHGHPKTASDLGDLAVDGDERCTRFTYADNIERWLIGMTVREETVAVACDVEPSRPDDLLGDTRTFYDGSTSFGTVPTTGQVTREEALDSWSNGPIYASQGETRFDELGRITAEVDALGNTTTTRFVPAGAGPVEYSIVTNPLGHAVTTYQHPQWAEPWKVVDANGVVTQLTYDPFGRLTGVWKDGRSLDEPANLKFSYVVRADGPLAVTSQELGPNGVYTTEIELLDSLYRPRLTQTSSQDGGRLLTETGYDDRGQEAYQSGPNFNAAGVDTNLVTVGRGEDLTRTVNSYDSLGRVIAEAWWSKNVEWWRTTTTYGGNPDAWQVSVTPPNGDTATAQLTNARDEVIELRQYHGPEPTGDYDATRYTYHANGERTSVTNASGLVWRFEYDLRGRQVLAADPDGGSTTIEYDDVDREIARTDARGNRVETTYDALDRELTQRSGDTLLAEYVYDTALLPNGNPATGHLSSSTTYIEGQALVQEINKYDFGYRATQTSAIIPSIPGLTGLSGTYLGTTTYYPDGSIHRMGLPALGGLEREIVAHEYNELGQPTRIVGTMYPSGEVTAYVDDATYSPYGDLAQRVLGSGDGPQAYQTYRYQDGTRRLERFSFDRDATVTNVASSTYWYDATGNILSVADLPEGQESLNDVQCFQYDYLRRMTEAWTQPSIGCVDAPDAGTVGGTTPYWNSYGFDTDGNRTSYEFGGATDRTAVSYTYGDGHRLDSVIHPDRTDRFEYDASGNTVVRDVAGSRQELGWDAQGRLTSIAEPSGDTTRMYYNTGGDRLARVDADGGATLFLIGHELTRSATDGVVSAVRYYEHDESVIASRDADELTWLGSDHQDTAQWSVNATTMVSTVQRQDPFGSKRGAQQQFLGQRGFVGSITDPTGLSHMGARQYDSLLGRFISVDPKVDYDDPQRMNAFAYSNNSPLTFSDPTGEAFNWSKLAKGADVVSAVAGGVALVAAVIPGAQPVAAAAGAIGVVAAGISVGSHLAAAHQQSQSSKPAVQAQASSSRYNAAWSAVGLIPGVGGVVKAGRAAIQTVKASRHLSGLQRAVTASRTKVDSLRNTFENMTRLAKPNLPNLRGALSRTISLFRDPTRHGQALALQNMRGQLSRAQDGLAAAEARAAAYLSRLRAARAAARKVSWNWTDWGSNIHWGLSRLPLPKLQPPKYKKVGKPAKKKKKSSLGKNHCVGNMCLW
ncbi:RHS repeat-associated protein [Stackebrandtia endophytica]|uniref:RHS repeat-associated protein n=1 Tax=Stackebrandtia endophytica TaxID=1496996 RepID=A0A543B128_9ACTN|nr:RHS repeat-associated core domain-containing protein [Stackebrandtia endophytica]TQL78537.1 RHS repeat-associated protein [Stackebrandtia endophytica]